MKKSEINELRKYQESGLDLYIKFSNNGEVPKLEKIPDTRPTGTWVSIELIKTRLETIPIDFIYVNVSRLGYRPIADIYQNTLLIEYWPGYYYYKLIHPEDFLIGSLVHIDYGSIKYTFQGGNPISRTYKGQLLHIGPKYNWADAELVKLIVPDLDLSCLENRGSLHPLTSLELVVVILDEEYNLKVFPLDSLIEPNESRGSNYNTFAIVEQIINKTNND